MGYIHDVGAEEDRGQDVVHHTGPKQDHSVLTWNAQGERPHNQRASLTAGIEVKFLLVPYFGSIPEYLCIMISDRA